MSAAAIGMAAALAAIPCPSELFRVVRNTNANVVLYEAQLDESRALDPRKPVHASWIMLAEDGHREELTPLERTFAYGFEVGPARADGITIALRAYPHRPISVRSRAGCPVAVTTIAGREAHLRVVSVEIRGALLPRILGLDLVGEDLETGDELHESIGARR